MLALIDIGNTTIEIGLTKDLVHIDNIVKINTVKTISADEYALYLKDILKDVTEAIISSVVPELNAVFREYFQKRLNFSPMFMTSGIKTGIKIIADNPREVGNDLVANIVGATEQYAKTCIIVDLGTATTLSYVDNCTFRGVIISAGLTTSKNALISKTSLLPQVELEIPTKLLGTNSSDSIKSGLVYGHVSMIEGMIARIQKQIGNETVPVVLTGGHAKLLYPLFVKKPLMDETLILKGLLAIYRRNTEKPIA